MFLQRVALCSTRQSTWVTLVVHKIHYRHNIQILTYLSVSWQGRPRHIREQETCLCPSDRLSLHIILQYSNVLASSSLRSLAALPLFSFYISYSSPRRQCSSVHGSARSRLYTDYTLRAYRRLSLVLRHNFTVAVLPWPKGFTMRYWFKYLMPCSSL